MQKKCQNKSIDIQRVSERCSAAVSGIIPHEQGVLPDWLFRQDYPERSAFALLGGHLYRSVVVLDDGMYYRETKAYPPCIRFCGKERIEDLADKLRQYTGAVITYRYEYGRSLVAAGSIITDRTGIESQVASVAHGIKSVHEKRKKNLS